MAPLDPAMVYIFFRFIAPSFCIAVSLFAAFPDSLSADEPTY
jgi:hypothetical protein